MFWIPVGVIAFLNGVIAVGQGNWLLAVPMFALAVWAFPHGLRWMRSAR